MARAAPEIRGHPAALKVEALESASALVSLRDEWTVLFESCPAATPFQSPEWLLAWLQHLGRA
jgi:CelD/BcsL family acetyltransferase involved in cellulose biosynthesis